MEYPSRFRPRYTESRHIVTQEIKNALGSEPDKYLCCQQETEKNLCTENEDTVAHIVNDVGSDRILAPERINLYLLSVDNEKKFKK